MLTKHFIIEEEAADSSMWRLIVEYITTTMNTTTTTTTTTTTNNNNNNNNNNAVKLLFHTHSCMYRGFDSKQEPAEGAVLPRSHCSLYHYISLLHENPEVSQRKAGTSAPFQKLFKSQHRKMNGFCTEDQRGRLWECFSQGIFPHFIHSADC